MRTAGSPASAITPCSDTVNGSGRRIHWAMARLLPGAPGLGADSRLDRALQRQRRRAAAERPRDDPRALRADAREVAEHEHGVDRTVLALAPPTPARP